MVVFQACQKTSMTFLSCPEPLKSKHAAGVYIQGQRYTVRLRGMFLFCQTEHELRVSLKVKDKHDLSERNKTEIERKILKP